MIRRVWSEMICAHFVYIWIKKIVDPNRLFSLFLSLCVTHPARSPGVNRVNSSLPAPESFAQWTRARSTTLDILKIFRTVKSRVLRSASSDIGPATICRSIPAAYRSEGNLPETIRLKSRLNSRARIFRTVTARALICLVFVAGNDLFIYSDASRIP